MGPFGYCNDKLLSAICTSNRAELPTPKPEQDWEIAFQKEADLDNKCKRKEKRKMTKLTLLQMRTEMSLEKEGNSGM